MVTEVLAATGNQTLAAETGDAAAAAAAAAAAVLELVR